MEEDKVWLASFHMIGAAQMWYHCLERNLGTPSWRRFTKLINTRFGPPLRKTGSISEFQEHFLPLLCRTDPLSEQQ